MNNKKHRTKKHHTVLPYITTPLIYVLISLVVVLPMCFALLSFSVEKVHNAQTNFKLTVDMLTADDSGYEPSDVKDGTVTLPSLYPAKKIGELKCSAAGMKTDVFFGSNRSSFRAGAGIESSAVPGQGKIILVYANATGGFKALYNVGKDDVITFETVWGTYKYKVDYTRIAGSVPEASEGETLVLTTAPNQKAFAMLEGNRLYVVCSKLSGPTVEEVQNEQ